MCCGCSACVQICPKQCIRFDEDKQGFRYPLVDKDECINCGLCEQVCPVLNRSEHADSIDVYAAINPNEKIRMESSSGGIFTMLAEETIKNGGIVFGASFNDKWEVYHRSVETQEEIRNLRGSKYLQSLICDTYKEVKSNLDKGRSVLFSGTPCQVSGLNCFLRKEYDNLLTIEVACHGVPSPLVWRDYIKRKSGGKVINDVSFRDKRTGYKTYSTRYVFKDKKYLKYYKRDEYMLGFIHNLTLRPSCFKCPSKLHNSCSDILIADFWGDKSTIDNTNGISLVVINSSKGMSYMQRIHAIMDSSNIDIALKSNPYIVVSPKEPDEYSAFWNEYCSKGVIALETYTKKYRPSFVFFVKMYISRLINR